MASPEEDDFQRHVAIELIVLDLERLARQAEAHDLTFLTHLIERALIEARKQLAPPNPPMGGRT